MKSWKRGGKRMLLFSEEKYKEFFTIIVNKIPLINKIFKKNNEGYKNKDVEEFVEFRQVHTTHDVVISEKRKFFDQVKDDFISTKPQNETQLYNIFLNFCWKNKSTNDLLPESKKVQVALNINKQERLGLQTRAIEEGILIKSGNNKIFFSKNFNSIEEVLEE